MTGEEQEACVSAVTNIWKDLSTWKSSTISGIDGNQLQEHDLLYDLQHIDFSPEALRAECARLGSSCSSFVFWRCDLSSIKILWDPNTRSIGIIDWEAADFIPKGWIRTKLRKSPGVIFDRKEEGVGRLEWAQRLIVICGRKA